MSVPTGASTAVVHADVQLKFTAAPPLTLNEADRIAGLMKSKCRDVDAAVLPDGMLIEKPTRTVSGDFGGMGTGLEDVPPPPEHADTAASKSATPTARLIASNNDVSPEAAEESLMTWIRSEGVFAP